jgi:uncharacterized membrane protein
MEGAHGFTLDSAAHLIQVALTPVFLLSGIAALLNVFASRLARVADQLEKLGGLIEGGCDETRAQANADVARLHSRSLVLDVAVVLGTLGAAATCLAIMTLFLLALSNKAIADVLLFMFGVAVLCTLGSVIAFGVEMLMSNNALRKRMHFHVPGLRFVFGARGVN